MGRGAGGVCSIVHSFENYNFRPQMGLTSLSPRPSEALAPRYLLLGYRRAISRFGRRSQTSNYAEPFQESGTNGSFARALYRV